MGNKDVNIAIGIISFVISFVLLFYVLFNKKKNKSEKWFIGLTISNMFMILGDFFEVACYGVSGFFSVASQWVFTIVLYYSSSGAMLFCMLGWLLSYVEIKKDVPKWIKITSLIFFVIQLVIAITMPFTKTCYINSDNQYVRGTFFYLNMVFPYLIYFMIIVFTIRYIKVFKKSEFGVIGIFVISPAIANIIQILIPDLLILNLAVTIGLILVLMFVQNRRIFDNEEKLRKLAYEENRKLEKIYENQENLINQLIEVLCGAVEAKDNYTKGHSVRVAQYAREIMYRLGGDEKAQQETYYIGILHDVGKIRVKDEIINKKGRLDNDEYEDIKLHTIAGYQILRNVDIIPDLAVGARFHHERYDGSGYPNGLSGENIPLIARIISVADAYDAMTSNRSYRSMMSQKDVREQIVKGMGTQFDPKIAQIMLNMIDEDVEYDMKQVDYDRVYSILMIDDDKFMHTIVEQILSDENYAITFASSGKEGIELLKENKYDLCLLDKEMPEMNGLEVLKWIHENVRKMKIILLTGDKDFSTIKKSMELGITDYISKPIKSKILKESISSVLRH